MAVSKLHYLLQVLCSLALLTKDNASAFSFPRDVQVASVSATQWSRLNHTVGGRLHAALPVSAPCFSVVNGRNVTPDRAVCQDVQQGYTEGTWRTGHFGAYMLLWVCGLLAPWETCQSTGRKCLLNSSNASDPAALESPCSQGSVPPYYIDVRSASDVQAAFASAREIGVRLAIKNGGHDYKGRSSAAGVLGIWVHDLDSLAYDANFRGL